MSVDVATIAQADRCAALLTLRMGGKVTRIGAVRVALGELADKLEEQEAASGQGGKASG
jgi:hypothetical protein